MLGFLLFCFEGSSISFWEEIILCLFLAPLPGVCWLWMWEYVYRLGSELLVCVFIHVIILTFLSLLILSKMLKLVGCIQYCFICSRFLWLFRRLFLYCSISHSWHGENTHPCLLLDLSRKFFHFLPMSMLVEIHCSQVLISSPSKWKLQRAFIIKNIQFHLMTFLHPLR